MTLVHPGEILDRPEQRMVAIEVVVGRRLVRADQVVVRVGRHLVGEHVLAGVLVAPVAGEALLVAVVDDRLAAGEEHQRVRQLRSCQQLGVARPDLVDALEEVADAAHVVVAEERRLGVGVAVGVGVVVVGLEERAQVVGGRALRGEPPRAATWKPKSIVAWSWPSVENSLMNGEPNCWSNTSPKAKKSSMPRSSAASRMAGPEGLPELHVDVLGGVDAETVDAELLDPEGVDVDHPFDDLATLGPQIVEAEEVSVQRVLAR